MSLTPRKAASLLGAAALGVAAMTGAGWAAGSAAQASVARPSVASVPRPSFSKLSASQVKARSSGKRERMVVVFDDQLTSLPANRAHRHAREAAAASMQAPLVAQLKQVRATHITTLSLLNAVAATMPAAEAQALSHTRGVKERRPRRNRHHRGRRQVQHEDGGRLPGAEAGHPGKGGRRAAIVQYKSQQTAGGARSPHQHPRNSSVQDRDGPGRHHRQRRRQLAGRERQHDPAQRAARDHRCPEPERERLQRRVQRRRLHHGRPGHGHLHLRVSAALLEHPRELQLPDRG